MARILHVDTSPRGARSRSRRVSADFIAAWRTVHPADEVVYRDLGRHPVPPVSEAWIAAAYTPPGDHDDAQRQAIAVSNELVDELLAADIYVFGVPMYNFSVPAPFKAYIDQVVRPGRTVQFEAGGPRGLLSGKRMFVLTSRGLDGYGPGEAAEAWNFQDPYIRAIFAYIGVTDATFIHSENNLAGEPDPAALSATQESVRKAVERAAGR